MAHRKSAGLLGILLIFFGYQMGCSADPSAEAKPKPDAKPTTDYRGTIVAVGNSLTAGLGVAEGKAYPALLARKLSADGHNFEVVNAGVSGETSSGALSRIQWVISSLNPDIVILETGANDGLRGIDPALLQSNLNKLIAILKANHILVVLAGMQMLPNLGPDYTGKFNAVYPQAAQVNEVIFVPFFLKGVAGRIDLNQRDKIHPTAEGYARIVDNIYPFVLNAIEVWEKNRHK
jgi:acyl-CoA thioesterase-1